eukprot:1141296-Pelagomonas_calceolata.AAC.6
MIAGLSNCNHPGNQQGPGRGHLIVGNGCPTKKVLVTWACRESNGSSSVHTDSNLENITAIYRNKLASSSTAKNLANREMRQQQQEQHPISHCTHRFKPDLKEALGSNNLLSSKGLPARCRKGLPE